MELNIIIGTFIALCVVGLAFVSGVQHGIRITKPNRAVDLDSILQVARLKSIGNTFDK
jgi:hypothetical protein